MGLLKWECPLYIPWLSAAMAFTLQAIDAAAATEVFGDGRNGSTPVPEDGSASTVAGGKHLRGVGECRVVSSGRMPRAAFVPAIRFLRLPAAIAVPICLVSKSLGSQRGVAGRRRWRGLFGRSGFCGALRRRKAGVNGIKNPEARPSSRAINYGSGPNSKLGADSTAKETMGIGIPLCGLIILFGWKRSQRSLTPYGNLRLGFHLASR